MTDPHLRLRVECYAGYRGEETPRCLYLAERRIEVKEVLDRWLGPDHRYFKLRGEDEVIYLLRHNQRSGEWELTLLDAT